VLASYRVVVKKFDQLQSSRLPVLAVTGSYSVPAVTGTSQMGGVPGFVVPVAVVAALLLLAVMVGLGVYVVRR
jgi:uncharacterized membrane protein